MPYVIKIGGGRDLSGKIIDYNTEWFNTANDALIFATTTNKKIFISHNKRRYKEITFEELRKLAYNEIKCKQN